MVYDDADPEVVMMMNARRQRILDKYAKRAREKSARAVDVQSIVSKLAALSGRAPTPPMEPLSDDECGKHISSSASRPGPSAKSRSASRAGRRA
mmetsp:Transcript_32521/g.75577  ORF Transcript_32521/g.75577 Transcript_32521/m.75577 type:complete len:94 (+) Transcript_32521:131-412(+)